MDYFIPIIIALLYAVMTKSYAAINYRYTDKICAEIIVNEKTVHNCDGHAIFKKGKGGKYSMEIVFRTNEFVSSVNGTKQLEKNIKKEGHELTFKTPELTKDEWTSTSKEVFQLVDTQMSSKKETVKLKDTMIQKKRSGSDQFIQIEAIVPNTEKEILALPAGIRDAKATHIRLIIPQNEIEGNKF